jgi:four helix bundle protein
VQDFRKLMVWQKAHELTLAVYRATKGFPQDERYGLTIQARRSAASVPANIAEACGRSGSGDFARFLDVASGSASELEYHLLLARDLGHLDTATHECLATDVAEIRQMLSSLRQKARPTQQTQKGTKHKN